MQQIEAWIAYLLLEQLDQFGAQTLHHFGCFQIVGLQYDPTALEQEQKVTIMQFHLEIGASKEHQGDEWKHGAITYVDGAGAHLLLVDKERCLKDGHL